MEANKILHASFLDILFDGRSKEYGAYELRKTYNIRLSKALGGMVAAVVLCFGLYLLSSREDGAKRLVMMVQDVQLEDLKEKKKNEPPPPPPAQLPPAKVEITRFTPPRIVRDNEVKEEEKPPDQAKLEDSKIGSINQEGVKDEGIVQGPGSDAGKGVVEAPRAAATEDYDKTFMKVEIESEYPGGRAAWQRFLNKNLRFPDAALNEQIQGTVLVQFIVDKDGNVSDVRAISGPDEGGLREEAIHVIEKSGKWNPGVQNGRQVKSYKNQPIIFMLATQ